MDVAFRHAAGGYVLATFGERDVVPGLIVGAQTFGSMAADSRCTRRLDGRRLGSARVQVLIPIPYDTARPGGSETPAHGSHARTLGY
jgi:hypothetical protein